MLSATETLEKCSLRLEALSGNIDRIRSLSSSTSTTVSRAPPPSPASPPQVTMPPKRAAARCHECHGPLTGYHQGYPHGLGVCQLEHYDMCPGGVLEKDKGGHSWASCPQDYEPPAPFEQDGWNPNMVHDAGHESDSQASQSSDPDYNPDNLSSLAPGGGSGPETRSSHNPGGIKDVDGSLPPTKPPSTSIPVDVSSAASNFVNLKINTNDETDVDLLLKAELAILAIAETKERKLKELADIRKRRDETQQNIDRLSRQAQGEGARRKDTIHSNIDLLRTANQTVARSRVNESGYTGPTIGDIRLDDYTRGQVETMMEHVHSIPSFSNAPHQRHGQPRLKQQTSQTQPSQPAFFAHGGANVGSKSPTSPVYKWVLMRNQYGEDYKELVQVPQPKPKSPARPKLVVDTEPGWQYDEQSNRMYRVQAPAHTILPQQHSFTDSRREGPTPVRHRAGVVHTPVRERLASGERLPGIVQLSRQPVEEKEGKIPMSIASHARNMPLDCAKSATSRTMNFAIFMYGAIHELHSSRIGITPPMQRGVLEAKLQHLMNVVHVTCLNASTTDFKPVAWSIGRTYHNLVQSKVDSGCEGWADFDWLHRGSPHAAEMIAAEREHRAALMRKPERPEIKNHKSDKKDEEKPACYTWNEYEVEGKCKWEADHPWVKCIRSHHCSFCKKNNPSLRTLHQARFCKQKLGDEA